MLSTFCNARDSTNLNQESKMDITIYRGFLKSNTFTPSSFVSKLEFRLRLGQVPHTVDAGSPLKAPRGKIPYVALSDKGDPDAGAARPTMLGDSGLIASALVAKGVLKDLNAHLTQIEKARDLALRGLLEDRLYWFHVGHLPARDKISLLWSRIYFPFS